MKIYNQEKTQILENPDLEKGYLQYDKIIIKTIPATEEVQEQFHYEYKYYDNGGADRKKIIDVEYAPAKPETYEYEDIQIYILYTEKEYAEITINKLTQELQQTDYIASKLAEAISKYIETGDSSDVIELRKIYSEELKNREIWRKEIDSLKNLLK